MAALAKQGSKGWRACFDQSVPWNAPANAKRARLFGKRGFENIARMLKR
jgi:hypothetical protein